MLASVVAAPSVRSEDWPAKPIRIIESLPAGVARDNRTREVAEKLTGILHQQVIVENRPGAAGRIAGDAAAKAAGDGITFIMMGTAETSITRHLYQLPYDIDRDFVPVSMIERLAVVPVIKASLPAANLGEFIAYAKAHPGEVTYGSTGTGLFLHLNGLLLGKAAGIELRHIPYTQSSPFTDLLGGHIDTVVDVIAPTLPNVRAGRLRALAVTGEHRLKELPEVPTFAEAGLPSYNVYGFYGLLAPKGTPSPIVARMQNAIETVLADESLRAKWEGQGGHPIASSSAEFADRIARESARWGDVVRANRIKVE
jgi:tripartite-type tricarboxylate transporter receptor subunit TctC